MTQEEQLVFTLGLDDEAIVLEEKDVVLAKKEFEGEKANESQSDLDLKGLPKSLLT